MSGVGIQAWVIVSKNGSIVKIRLTQDVNEWAGVQAGPLSLSLIPSTSSYISHPVMTIGA